MKKAIVILMIVVMSFAVIGCGGTGSSSSDSGMRYDSPANK